MFRSAVRSFVLFNFLILFSNAYAQDLVMKIPDDSIVNSDSTTTPKIKASMYSLVWGRDIEDSFSKSVSALTYLEPRIDALYNSWLSFDLQFSGFFVAGNTQNFYTDEGKSTNGLYLEEAAANFKPFTN